MEMPIATLAKLQADETGRAVQALQKTAELALHTPEPEAMAQGAELIEATRDRAVALQKQWMNDWANWVSYAKSLEGADTVPKFAERTGNIALQAQSLVVAHVSQWSELMDNVGVNYAYWVNRQVGTDRS